MSNSCLISTTGISAPTLQQIIDNLVASYQTIYGSDSYLQNDSSDYQLIAVFAAAINDNNSACIAAYNSFNPNYSQGVGLSLLVGLNGLTRQPASNSTADVLVVGQAGSQLINPQVTDASNNNWALSLNGNTSFDIPLSGEVTALATCLTQGAIELPSYSATIATPTFGWQTAAFVSTATPGNNVETDAQLRARQTLSTSINSTANVSAVASNVAQIEGVIDSVVYENFKSTVGIPAAGNYPAVPSMAKNSICVVAEGGDPLQICQVIADTKAPGCNTYSIGQPPSYVPTYETVTVPVLLYPNLPFNPSTNPYIQTTEENIYYQAAIQVPMTATLTITPKPGYNVGTKAQTVTNLANYINGLGIGISFEYAEALAACVNPLYKLESIAITVNGTTYTNADIPQTFASYFYIALANIAFSGG
jgi:uncharacterized phage protein gp47/JayE